MLGNIEEAIMANYKRALENGNFTQAGIATELAGKLRDLIEHRGFVDQKKLADQPRLVSLNVFRPIPYTFDSESAVVYLFNQIINLTPVENRLFLLLSQNETSFDNIKVLKPAVIKQFVWQNRIVTNNALRILVRRLRKKIEPNQANPELIINFNRKGYVFLGKAKQ